ncbi:MAG: hypothetical protein LBV74_22720 [Tannerella sp.]|jgi:hypothetical protein|nr:hypothetical protein [Tannerella sp.]
MSVVPSAATIYITLKKVMELKQKFVEKKAVSPETALTLKELGVQKKGLFRLMLLKKRIIENDGRYFFDVAGFDEAAINRLQRFISELFDDLKDK